MPSLPDALLNASPRVHVLSLLLGLTVIFASLWMHALYTSRTRMQRSREARAAEAAGNPANPDAGRGKAMDYLLMGAIWLGVIVYEIILIGPVSGWNK